MDCEGALSHLLQVINIIVNSESFIIFLQQVTVTQKSRVKNTNEEFRVGKLFMIDLAGSERAAQTKVNGFCFLFIFLFIIQLKQAPNELNFLVSFSSLICLIFVSF